MKSTLGNVFIFLTSVVISLAAAEVFARMFLDPVDYLSPILVADDFLGHRVVGHTGGHDAWGFRNPEVPRGTDIVCIGDSMTYGEAARARDSWPAVLATMLGEKTYNMALGGYGPIQYLFLLRTRAMELHPRTVIVGLYLGNDLVDAFNMVQSRKNWSAYRIGNFSDLPPQPIFQPHPDKFLGNFRDWLHRKSVLYVLVTQLPLFNFVRKEEALGTEESYIRIRYQDGRHNEIFYLDSRWRPLDLTDPSINAGLQITERAITEMSSDAKQNAVRLIVAVIPTKERVYADVLKDAGYLAENAPSRQKNLLTNNLRDEEIARESIVSFLQEHQIEVVDLLPPMSLGVQKQDLYPVTEMHPNRAGYRVIAGTIARYLHGGDAGKR